MTSFSTNQSSWYTNHVLDDITLNQPKCLVYKSHVRWHHSQPFKVLGIQITYQMTSFSTNQNAWYTNHMSDDITLYQSSRCLPSVGCCLVRSWTVSWSDVWPPHWRQSRWKMTRKSSAAKSPPYRTRPSSTWLQGKDIYILANFSPRSLLLWVMCL